MARYCPQKQNYALYPDCKECDDRVCEAFFCLVVGSRTFKDYDLLERKLDVLLSRQNHIVIVSGGAAGADTLAEQYAENHGYKCIVFPAKWKTYGKKAGFLRNRKMHEFIAKMPRRGCVAFWDGKSSGTPHNFGLAKEFKTQLKIVFTNTES